MSEENVNKIRDMYAAFGRGDIPAVLAGLHPQVEWWEAENFIYAEKNPYVGPNEVLEGVFMRLGGEWDGFGVEAKQVLDAGETVVAEGHYSGTYKKTGSHVKAQFAHLFTFRDGQVIKFQQYTDTAQFAQAVAG
ncbi:MAG TPA: nuclear transport factor 2 family protein [Pyrinomonadaceae bacterium]|nr:nuclear transport factor 2 family protein [Pyrinomonadaceae bacterium]